VPEAPDFPPSFRRHAYFCPSGHPDGVYRLDLFFDYGAFPVWGRRGGRHGMMPASLLGISERLAADLQAWADRMDPHPDGSGSRAEGADLQAAGRALAGRLAAETGAEVVYGVTPPRERDPDCPHCGTRPNTGNNEPCSPRGKST
jgi:hypothetical protein